MVCIVGRACVFCTRHLVYLNYLLPLYSRLTLCHRTLALRGIVHVPLQALTRKLSAVHCLLRAASWKCCTHCKAVLLPFLLTTPSYILGDTLPSTAHGYGKECAHRMLLISSTTAAEGMPTLSDHHNPAVEAPSLTGVPSPGTPGGIPLVELNAPIVGLGFDVLEGVEPPPAYTRFGGVGTVSSYFSA